MLFYGKKGSLILFYNDLLIGSYPLSNFKTYERYKHEGDDLIVKSLKTSIPLKLQILTYTSFCNMIYDRKSKKLGIYKTDYQFFLCAVFALIKLKQLEEDNCVYIVDKPKK